MLINILARHDFVVFARTVLLIYLLLIFKINKFITIIDIVFFYILLNSQIYCFTCLIFENVPEIYN